MAEQTISTALQTIQFRKDFFREYVRTNRFSPYTGKGVDNAIVIKMGKGPTLRHPLVTRLKSNGVTGSAMLRGNGESIGNYSWDTNPTYYRNAVEFNKEDLEKTNLALMAEARPLLLQWAMAETRDRQIEAMGAHYDGSTYANYGGTGWTAAIANAWLVQNKTRTQFGAYAAGGSSGGAVLATDLAQIDATSDKFTYTQVSSMRALAENADPHIYPYNTTEEGEVYVIFAGSTPFRDLKASLVTINQNADVRGMKITSGGNILARDGDLFYDGCIIRKVPEIDTIFSDPGQPLATAGTSSVRVGTVFLCGRQALVQGMGQAPEIVVDRDFDFQFRPAVAVELKEDVKKAFFNDWQHGMVTGFFSGVK
jgi:hypothetical protein